MIKMLSSLNERDLVALFFATAFVSSALITAVICKIIAEIKAEIRSFLKLRKVRAKIARRREHER